MATLQDIIDQVQDEMESLPGVRAAPDEPPDQINVFPFVVTYADNGEYYIGPPELIGIADNGAHHVHVRRARLGRSANDWLPVPAD